MSIDPKKTAVVLIEYQNDFTSEGGVLHGAVSEVQTTAERRFHADIVSSLMISPATFRGGKPG